MIDRQDQLALLNNLPGMAYRCHHDAGRKLLFASEGCLELTGYPATELVGDQDIVYASLIHTEDRPAVQKEIEEAIKEKRPYYCTYRLTTADKRERWVWETGRCTYDDDDTPGYLEGFVSDATNQIVAVQQLEQRITDRTRKLSALYDILELAGKPAELSEVIKKSLQRVLAATQGEAGFIHLRAKTGKTLRLIAQYGIPESLAEKIGNVSPQDGLVSWVSRNRQALVIPNVNEDPRTVYLSTDSHLKVYAGVPIATRERMFGTLSVLGRDPAQFDAEEVALLASIGEGIGIVVENARLRRHSERLLVVQERNRLARELHDSVTQSLYSLTLFAEAGRRIAKARKEEEAADYFSQIGETGQQALKEMRLLVHRLRPSILSKEGLVRALQHRLNSVEGRAGVRHKMIVENEIRLSPALENAVYQIAQEALNNALKHAMASEVIVHLSIVDGQLVVLQVEDNGRGFDPGTAAVSDGMGLTNMQERTEMFDGQLTIQSVPGQGTTVKAKLKVAPKKPRRQDEFGFEDLL
jgi:PAS domain S-box-containing protein